MPKNSFNAKSVLTVNGKNHAFFRLETLEKAGLCRLEALPYCIRVLLENLLRLEDGHRVEAKDIEALAGWRAKDLPDRDIPFLPARVLLQDFTGVPVVADLAALREAARVLG